MFEAAVGFFSKHADARHWFSGQNVQHKLVWNRLCEEIAPERHFGSMANFLYLDGHVQSIPAETVRLWADTGLNFGLPNKGEYVP